MSLGFIDQSFECNWLGFRQCRNNPSIQFNIRPFKSCSELPVREVILTGSGVRSDSPEPSKILHSFPTLSVGVK